MFSCGLEKMRSKFGVYMCFSIFPRFYTYPESKKNKKNSSPSRKITKFVEQGDTIILRITAKNGIKIQCVARDMDLCLLKKSVSTCTNLPFAY